MHSNHGRRGPRAPWLIAAVMLVVGTAGCTMCPDPFDYSGPVAGGGPAQNDFGARTNGILPVRAAPTPWPPVVSDTPTEGPPAEEATGNEVAGTESVLKTAEEPPATATR